MKANLEFDFTPAGYLSLIRTLQARGYELRDFVGADSAAPHLILRHDVDLSLELAAEMAQLEAKHGILATYFVLVRSEFYNPASAAGRAALRAIKAGGHRIGLHFDAALHSPEEINSAAKVECAILESLIDSCVEVISFHRPPAAYVGGDELLGGRLNAYAERFVREIGYCSDSRGAWQHGSPLDHPALASRRALQLLTHPIWWMGNGAGPREKLRRFLADRCASLDIELAQHCAVHAPGSIHE